MIYDISPIINDQIKVWPGDNTPSREILLEVSQGDSVTLSTLRSTVHVGAHADAPSHYDVEGETIETRGLEHYLGSAQVISVNVKVGEAILPKDLTTPISAKRILLKTSSYPDPTNFTTDFAACSPELIDFLHEKDVITIGIDTPSVDLFHLKDLPSHHAVNRHDMAILEGLVLAHVPDGTYELIALPLPLAGFDASPVRAVLRTISK